MQIIPIILLAGLSSSLFLAGCASPTGGTGSTQPPSVSTTTVTTSAEITPFVGSWESSDSYVQDADVTYTGDSLTGGMNGQITSYKNQALTLNVDGTGIFTATVQLESYPSKKAANGVDDVPVYDFSVGFVENVPMSDRSSVVPSVPLHLADDEHNYHFEISGNSNGVAPIWNMSIKFRWSIADGNLVLVNSVANSGNPIPAVTFSGDQSVWFGGIHQYFCQFHGKQLWGDNVLTGSNATSQYLNNVQVVVIRNSDPHIAPVIVAITAPIVSTDTSHMTTQTFSLFANDQVWTKTP